MIFFRYLSIAVLSVAITSLDLYLARNGVIFSGSEITLIAAAMIPLIYYLLKAVSSAGSHSKLDTVHLPNSVVLPWIVFSFIVVFSALWSINAESAIQGARIFVGLNLFSATIFALLCSDMGRRIVRAALLVSIFIYGGTTLYDVIYPGSFSKLITRAAGISINPNLSAYNICVAAAVYLSISDKENKSVLFVPLIVFISISVFFTLSRGGFILLLTFIVLAGYRFIRRSFKSRMFFIVGAPLSIVALAGAAMSYTSFSSNSTTAKRLAMFTGEAAFIASDESRLQIAGAHLITFGDAPLLGTGYGDTYTVNNEVGHSTHNIYIKILLELGMFGLVLYLLSLLVFGVALAKHETWQIVLPILIAVSGFLSNTILDNRVTFAALATILYLTSMPGESRRSK